MNTDRCEIRQGEIDNSYLRHVSKLEFVITYACTGRCKHCSEGEHSAYGVHIDPDIAADVVYKIASRYPLQTVMTFGGEPLLYPDAVFRICAAAREAGVPNRQLITNGYFSADASRIGEVAKQLAECGVNDVLVSVDAFHQETIPLKIVKMFVNEMRARQVPLRLQPAWLVSAENDNPYNRQTREILAAFEHVPVGEGNVVFCEGNAKRYLAEYFQTQRPENPYAEDPRDVRCLSVDPSGELLGDNLYRRDVMDILHRYTP